MKHATKHLAATALALTLLCTGCSTAKNSTPEEKPTQPSPTQTPSQTPTPKSGWEDGPPLLPVQAQNNTQEGAIATGKFFIEAHDYAIQTGDMQPLHEVLLKDGDANESIKELEKRLNEKGTWVGEKATKELVAVEPQNDESFFLQFLVTQPPHTHSTNKTEKAPKKKFDYAMNLVYKSDRWQIKSLASRYANDEEGQDNGSH